MDGHGFFFEFILHHTIVADGKALSATRWFRQDFRFFIIFIVITITSRILACCLFC
jgi:hypothetical protein